MNSLLSLLEPYPFQRLHQLFDNIHPNPELPPINLGIGEPQHATPAGISQALCDAAVKSTPSGLSRYPTTAGTDALRQTFASWLKRRYGVTLDALTQTLPVNGSREALFALTQAVIDRSASRPIVVCPNPFYQIYEGAALLAGAQPYFVASDPGRNFAPEWDSVPESIWAATQQVFVCSPGNPAGAVMQLQDWQKLFALSDRFGFVMASDECYSEIYFGSQPPLGGLQASMALGRPDFKNLVLLTSLSKRSSVPGLRSGFVAGDQDILAKFLLYRTYHGCAMSPVVQQASIAAWNDEDHVAANRALYQAKFEAVTPLLQEVMAVKLPDAGFYLWIDVGGCDTSFVRDLYASHHVTLLPGSFLARSVNGHNPGAGYVRLALVADMEQCLQAARRIQQFCRQRQS